MWTEWLVAAAVLIGFLALLPLMLRQTKPTSRKFAGSGVVIGLGMVFAMIFDPKAVQATEEVQKAKEICDSEKDEQADPLS
jgi:hypothetical protein